MAFSPIIHYGMFIFALAWATEAIAVRTTARGTNSFKVTIVNKHPEDIIALNINNDGTSTVPMLETGQVSSTISTNATATYLVTGSWAGGWHINTVTGGISGSESLIEGSYDPSSGLYLDISNVKGFTLPIVCGCEKKGMIVGCNKDLKALNGGCPKGTDNGRGACMNFEAEVSRMPDFHKPCEGGSYAHVSNHAALEPATLCQNSHLTCCVGTDCPDSFRQSGANNTGYHLIGTSGNWTSTFNLASTLSGGSASTDIYSPFFRPLGIMQILPVEPNSTSVK